MWECRSSVVGLEELYLEIHINGMPAGSSASSGKPNVCKFNFFEILEDLTHQKRKFLRRFAGEKLAKLFLRDKELSLGRWITRELRVGNCPNVMVEQASN